MTERTGKKVMFYVQHLLGSGHLQRAATLARAMAASGLDVTLVSGGMPLPHLDLKRAQLVQLPPVRAADAAFSALLDDRGNTIDEAWKQTRISALLGHFHRICPDALLVELFPFGRRLMRFELLPLLDAAQSAVPRPLILSSVRDVLVAQNKPQRVQEMADLATQRFDAVLVHSDPEVIAFDRTFPLTARIAPMLHYTGYVVETDGKQVSPQSRQGVIVSAGSGPIGMDLLQTALEARPHTKLAADPWRLLVAHTIGEADFGALQAQQCPGVTVERARTDFRDLLAAATLSVSQAGYNTSMEVLGAGTRAVFAPFSGATETEQMVRAQALADRGLCQLVPAEALNAETLAKAIDRALDLPPAQFGTINCSGSQTTARLLTEMLSARDGSRPP